MHTLVSAGSKLGKPYQHAMLIEAAAILERALIDGQPHQRDCTTVIAQQGQHDGGLLVGIEICPVHGDHDGAAFANDERHLTEQNVIDINGCIGKQTVDLLDGMLWLQTTGSREALANGTDRQRAAMQHAKGRVA
jgi:hypothetical protein